MRIFILLSCAALLGSGSYAAISPTSPLTDWTALPYNGPNSFSDYINDTQAESADLDMVGYGSQFATYTQFDQQNTLGFRLRLAGDQNPVGFSGQAWIGADLNMDGNLDIFVGASKSAITINYPGDLENVSPSTTSIQSSPIFSTPASSLNFNWSPVDSINDPIGPLYDIDGSLDSRNTSGVDYFLTFTIPFDSFSTAASGLEHIDGFNAESTLSYTFLTATQSNSLNADIGGVNGMNNTSMTWVNIGGLTPELTVEGALIPEPAHMVLILSSALFLFVILRRNLSGK